MLKKGASGGIFPMCNVKPESNCYLFLLCDFVKRTLFSGPLGIRVPEVSDIVDWLDAILATKDFELG